MSLAPRRARMWPAAAAHALAVQAPPARRQVSIAGKRVRVVDVHAHCDVPLGDVVKGTPFEKQGPAT